MSPRWSFAIIAAVFVFIMTSPWTIGRRLHVAFDVEQAFDYFNVCVDGACHRVPRAMAKQIADKSYEVPVRARIGRRRKLTVQNCTASGVCSSPAQLEADINWALP